MKAGQLIAVGGKLYEYGEYIECFKLHVAYEVMVDEDGYLTATHSAYTFADQDLTKNEINFTKDQWYGIVAHFIREGDFHLNEEEIEDATEDIVERCFTYGIPKFHELPEYIAEYMNR